MFKLIIADNEIKSLPLQTFIQLINSYTKRNKDLEQVLLNDFQIGEEDSTSGNLLRLCLTYADRFNWPEFHQVLSGYDLFSCQCITFEQLLPYLKTRSLPTEQALLQKIAAIKTGKGYGEVQAVNQCFEYMKRLGNFRWPELELKLKDLKWALRTYIKQVDWSNATSDFEIPDFLKCEITRNRYKVAYTVTRTMSWNIEVCAYVVANSEEEALALAKAKGFREEVDDDNLPSSWDTEVVNPGYRFEIDNRVD